MRRKSIYYVGGDKATFDADQWDKLLQALPFFGSGFHNPEEYKTGPKSPHAQQTFWVARADGRSLTVAELNALYWFFRGVMIAHNMTGVV